MSTKWGTKLVATACTTFAMPLAHAAAARLTIDSVGLKRTALIVEHAPLKLARRPLVIVLHGENGNGARIRRRLGIETVARSANPIFLYPDAIHGRWSAAPGEAAKSDIAMLRDFTTTLVRRGLVNSRLVFLVGDSTGGAMAIRAVCSGLDQPIAGLATIDTAVPADLTATCAPPKPLAYIDVNGRGASPAAVAIFARANGCSRGPSPAPLVVTDRLDRDVAFIERFSDCKAPVEQVRIVGNEKTSSVKIGASNNRAFSRAKNFYVDAAHLVWAFLKKLGA